MKTLSLFLSLAIATLTFAVDSHESILRATRIRETSVKMTWDEIPGATAYKVFFDEDSLIDPSAPLPLLESEKITQREIEITKLTNNTPYYFVIQGYDSRGLEVARSIPLHAQTYTSVPFTVVSEPSRADDQTISLSFSRPIDLTQTEVSVRNTTNGNVRTVTSIETHPEDLRILQIHLRGKIGDAPHEVILKKVTAHGNIAMSEEFLRAFSVMGIPAKPVEEVSPVDPVAPPAGEKQDVIVETAAAEVIEQVVVETSIPEVPIPAPEKSPEIVDVPAENAAIEPATNDTVPSEDILLSESSSAENTETPKPALVPIDTLPATGLSHIMVLFMSVMMSVVLFVRQRNSQ